MNTFVLLGLCACICMAAADTCPSGSNADCSAQEIKCDTGYELDCVHNVCTCTKMHGDHSCSTDSDCGAGSCTQHSHNHQVRWRCWHGHCRCTFH